MLKPYEKYIPVESKWIDSIPSTWGYKRVKELFIERKERNNPIKTHEILALTAKQGVIPYSQKRSGGGNKAKEDLTQYNIAHPNDLLINCMNVVAGSAGVSKYYGAISPVYYALSQRDDSINIWYYHRIFRLMPFQRSLLGLGKGILMRESSSGALNTVRMRIPMSNLNNVMLPVPPREEQDQIVRFLDWKLAKINKLIRAKKKQIALLNEQKQVIINNAVTKGLDPNVPMKDSGIEWIGCIPSNWHIDRIRHFCTLQNGISEAGDFFSSGYPFVSYGDVYNNMQLPFVVDGVAKSNSKQQQIYSVKKGDIFFTRTSETIGEIGISSVCEKTIDNAVFSGFLIRVRPTSNQLYSQYSKYYFRSSYVREYFSKEMNIVTRASLGQTLLKNMWVILPPYNEQCNIASYLNDRFEVIDQYISKINKQIELFSEYRTRLISDVVTGKVDVRGIEIPEYEAVPDDVTEDEFDGENAMDDEAEEAEVE